MPAYLLSASYTVEGTKGLLKDGGSRRRDVVQQMVAKVGGTLHAFFFAFGEADLYLIVELPDAATAAALSLAVNVTGTATLRTTQLLTPEELDAATKKSIGYRPPGT